MEPHFISNYWYNRVVYPYYFIRIIMSRFLGIWLLFIILLYILFKLALSMELSWLVPTEYYMFGTYIILLQHAVHSTNFLPLICSSCGEAMYQRLGVSSWHLECPYAPSYFWTDLYYVFQRWLYMYLFCIPLVLLLY